MMAQPCDYTREQWTNKDLVYSTGYSTQYSVTVCMGKEPKKSGDMYMYNWFTLLYTWNWHNIVNQLYSNKNFLKNELYTLNE